MLVKIIENNDETYEIGDLVAEIKKDKKIDYSGAIFTFEGFVRGKEENMNLKKLILTTPNKEKALDDIKKIINEVTIKFGVYNISLVHYIGEFYTGDSLFLVCVLGPHRNETMDALKEVIERVKFDVDFKKEEISDNGTKIIMAGG